MERTQFKTLVGLRLAIREATEEDTKNLEVNVNLNDLVIFRFTDLKIVASVSQDDLFDEHGNRFDFD